MRALTDFVRAEDLSFHHLENETKKWMQYTALVIRCILVSFNNAEVESHNRCFVLVKERKCPVKEEQDRYPSTTQFISNLFQNCDIDKFIDFSCACLDDPLVLVKAGDHIVTKMTFGKLLKIGKILTTNQRPNRISSESNAKQRLAQFWKKPYLKLKLVFSFDEARLLHLMNLAKNFQRICHENLKLFDPFYLFDFIDVFDKDAILFSRLSLSISPQSKNSTNLCSYVFPDRQRMYIEYSSEPTLVKAASAMMSDMENYKRLLKTLCNSVKNGIVDAGFRGNINDLGAPKSVTYIYQHDNLLRVFSANIYDSVSLLGIPLAVFKTLIQILLTGHENLSKKQNRKVAQEDLTNGTFDLARQKNYQYLQNPTQSLQTRLQAENQANQRIKNKLDVIPSKCQQYVNDDSNKEGDNYKYQAEPKKNKSLLLN
ncbi:696_t:CDS:2 [Entrophospora sp. SA101]|nr:696_t:CDS:2 [Entrophospora sp. SA101]